MFAACPDNCAKCDWEEDKTICKPDRCMPEHVQVPDDPRKACVSECHLLQGQVYVLAVNVLSIFSIHYIALVIL